MDKNPHDEKAKRVADKANDRREKTKEGAKSHGPVKHKSVKNSQNVDKQQNCKNNRKGGGKKTKGVGETHKGRETI